MNLTQNEFIHLVNSYYQADAYSKKIIASGIFGQSDIQAELFQFREMLENQFPKLKILIDDAERNGNNGETEKLIIKGKLTEIYKIPNWFYEELENSVSKFIRESNSDMTSYRLIFQMGSDYLYNFVGATAQNFGNHVPLKDGIEEIVHSILFENYWEGDELRQQINFIRNLKQSLFLSENWIKEYAYKMFVN